MNLFLYNLWFKREVKVKLHLYGKNESKKRFVLKLFESFFSCWETKAIFMTKAMTLNAFILSKNEMKGSFT